MDIFFSICIDTVNYNILLSKLRHYDFRAVISDLCSSYLSNRKQTTEINGVISAQQSIGCRVPQCSVLDPIFFYKVEFFPLC